MVAKLFLLLISVINVFANVNSIVNREVYRTVHIESMQTVIIYHNISFKNNSPKVVRHYHFYIDPSYQTAFRYKVYSTSSDDSRINASLINNTYLEIELPTPLNHGQTRSINIVFTLIGHIRPLYKARLQYSKLWLILRLNVVFYSCYPTEKDSMMVVLITKEKLVMEYVVPEGSEIENDQVVFGPYKYVSTYGIVKSAVQFIPSSPIMVVESLERVIDASSMFGSIMITDVVTTINDCGVLKGDYTHEKVAIGSESAIMNTVAGGFATILPSSAENIEYYDDLGAIYSFTVHERYDSVDSQFKFRYPLLSGWRIKYQVSYRVPAYEYLFFNGNKFSLKTRLFDHIFDNMLIKHAITTVILPPGSQDPSIEVPVYFQGESFELNYYGVEELPRFIGMRPKLMLTFKAENVLEQDLIDDFVVNFVLAANPFILAGIYVAGIYIVFLIAVLYNRVDFNIYQKNSDMALVKVRTVEPLNI